SGRRSVEEQAASHSAAVTMVRDDFPMVVASARSLPEHAAGRAAGSARFSRVFLGQFSGFGARGPVRDRPDGAAARSSRWNLACFARAGSSPPKEKSFMFQKTR